MQKMENGKLVDLTPAKITERNAENVASDLEAIEFEKTEEKEWRDRELQNSDHTQLPDTPLLGAQVIAWKTYRQELRDLPTVAGFPDISKRPAKPT